MSQVWLNPYFLTLPVCLSVVNCDWLLVILFHSCELRLVNYANVSRISSATGFRRLLIG